MANCCRLAGTAGTIVWLLLEHAPGQRGHRRSVPVECVTGTPTKNWRRTNDKACPPSQKSDEKNRPLLQRNFAEHRLASFEDPMHAGASWGPIEAEVEEASPGERAAQPQQAERSASAEMPFTGRLLESLLVYHAYFCICSLPSLSMRPCFSTKRKLGIL